MTIKEAAAARGCSEKTIRRDIERGVLPAYQYVPRGTIHIDPADFENYRKRARIEVVRPGRLRVVA